MSYELKGKVKVINDLETFASGFQKKSFVVTSEDQYPQDIIFELFGDKIDIIDVFKKGDDVSVKFNVRGKEFTNAQGEIKYYNNLVAWSVQRTAATPAQQPQTAPQPKPEPKQENPFDDNDEDEDDSLPF